MRRSYWRWGRSRHFEERSAEEIGAEVFGGCPAGREGRIVAEIEAAG